MEDLAKPTKDLGNRVPAVILAGGKSSRMHGENKALMKLGNKRLIEHVLSKLNTSTKNIALNINSDYRIFEAYNLPLLTDTIGGFLGPLAGVLSAMKWAEEIGHSKVLTVAADTPFFPENLFSNFEGYIEQYDIVMACTEDDEGNVERHPTFCMWSTELRENLELSLRDGLRKIVCWTDKFNVKNMKFKIERFDPFFNINTKEDLQLAEKLLIGDFI
ncbi:MAG: molybdenum cofactor guanylyltransferase MobA [Paracoccaceae bacterium]